MADVDHIRVLQVGDVHFPDGQSSANSIDIKDDGLSATLKQSVGANAFQMSTRKILKLIQDEPFDAIIFMGDLTSRGSLEGYERCAQFFSEALRMQSNPSIAKERIIFVAGNHDVNRELALTNPDKKFSKLSTILEQNGFMPLTNTAVDRRLVSNGTQELMIYGLNSCIGCGEKRFLPERVRDVIFQKLANDFSDASTDKNALLEDVYEQLDAPAIHRDTIESLVNDIEGQADHHLGVVVAHHNILPQSFPRIAPYTELLNSGSLRSTMSQMNRPLLYLHGHIHTDPIEIVTNAVKGKSPVVCISAPAIVGGFNVLEIGYSGQNRPIGCRVRFYRPNEAGYVAEDGEVMIPLNFQPGDVLAPAISQVAAIILEKKALTWLDLRQALDLIHARVKDHELSALVIELYWRNLISVENYRHDALSWRIGSNMG